MTQLRLSLVVAGRFFAPLLLAGAMACSAAAAAAQFTLAQTDTDAASADVQIITAEPASAAAPPPPAPITDTSAPEEALQRLLAEARATMPAACEAKRRTALLRVLCADTLRVGIRGNYPLFATLQDGDRVGYDTDVGRALADWLGVTHEWVQVRAATRISTLAEGGADVVVATMGHNTRRDAQARFIRPHYYRSQTIVVGPKGTEVGGFEDLDGRSVCTTIGNYANSNIVA
ncbi:MAG: transporter substrate-binding domain-containing protein, partial [Pseudomonadota bacterium]